MRSDDGRARERGGEFDRIMGAEEESEGERRGVSDGRRERQGERERERAQKRIADCRLPSPTREVMLT